LRKSKIKICGIKEIITLDCCIENNIDFFGLVFFKRSPRNIKVDKALELINYSKKKEISAVGVFVNEPIISINKTIKKLKLQYIQLHGDEDNDYICSIKKKNTKIIKNIAINSKEDLLNTNKYPDADIFLFDYKPSKNELPGGNAKSFNWKILENIKINKPWFLSGGIDIKNIKEIKEYVIPYGIDISSGVEVELGIKSNEKIISLRKKYESR
jgi:phosphoribosylanthranilate isomerase